MSEEENHFDSSRAELFEALGHPIRVKILRTLEARPMGFAELKREVGIESSGHLQFHLGKLAGLVGTTSDGFYTLTDDGREALRVATVTSQSHHRGSGWTWNLLPAAKATLVVVVVALIMLSAFAVVQQQQITSLNQSLSQQQAGTVVINGTRYAYAEIPLSSLSIPMTVKLNGVTFNLTAQTPLAPGGVMLVTFTGVNASAGLLGNRSIQITLRFAPVITVVFDDGQKEQFGATAAPTFQNGTTFQIGNAAATSWFSLHKNPQAGVSWNPTTGTYTFYVSLVQRA